MKELGFQLADMLSGDMSPEEMKAIIDRHNLKLQEVEEEFDDVNTNEQKQLLKELSEKHQTKLNALIWKHEQLVIYIPVNYNIFMNIFII